jgi:ferritin-like metal-binding protein YciE
VQGLFDELKEVRQSRPSAEVLEGVVVGGAAKTEHYEIAAYTGLASKARAMGQTDAARLLEQNLAQEQAMLHRVEQVAERLTQRMATMAGGASTGRQTGTSAS